MPADRLGKLPHHDASDRAAEKLRRMTSAERTETLVAAGILTREHVLAEPYAEPPQGPPSTLVPAGEKLR